MGKKNLGWRVHAFPKGTVECLEVDHEQALKDYQKLRGRLVRDAIYNFFRMLAEDPEKYT